MGVQVVTSDSDDNIINILRKNGYALTVLPVEGMNDDNSKYMLFIEIDKKRFNDLKRLIKSLDKKAFIVVNETKFVQNGYFK